MLTVKEKYVDDPRLNTMARIARAAPTWSSERINSRMSQTFIADSNRRSEIFRLRIADCGLRIEVPNRQSEIAKRGERDRRISSIRIPHSAIRNLRGLLLSFSSVPDKYNGWLIPAVAAGLRAVRQTRVKLIYSSAPYFTSHLAGYWLALLTGLPWWRISATRGSRGCEEYRPGNKICFGINRALERMTVSAPTPWFASPKSTRR